ncbi:MAG: hypothetical protein ACPGJV_16180 [Bacteriovoracaceae bacterium]
MKQIYTLVALITLSFVFISHNAHSSDTIHNSNKDLSKVSKKKPKKPPFDDNRPKPKRKK